MSELWAVSCIFNPSSYATKLTNYRLFREGIKAQGVKLLTVELAFPGQTHQLSPDDAEILLQLNAEDIMWQKERLFNLAVRKLPAACRYVAFLDADLRFSNQNWPAQTIEKLKQVPICQPFSTSIRMRKGQSHDDVCGIEALEYGHGDGRYLNSFARLLEQRGKSSIEETRKQSSVGFAWAMRRDFIEKHGWYDAGILGSGDLLLVEGIFGKPRHTLTRFARRQRAHYLTWVKGFAADVKGEVGAVEGMIFHYWHGDYRNRKYIFRDLVLKWHGFDPSKDIAKDANGLWRWTSPKPAFHRAVAAYFDSRKEDGGGSAIGQKSLFLIEQLLMLVAKLCHRAVRRIKSLLPTLGRER